MITKTITYTDYDGEEKTETFYFHLSKAEITSVSLEHPEGLEEYVKKIVSDKNGPEMFDLFSKLILMSYGEKVNGVFVKKRKGEPLCDIFEASPAYDALFDELSNKPEEAKKFFEGILPKNVKADK